METLPKHPAMVKCEYHTNITIYVYNPNVWALRFSLINKIYVHYTHNAYWTLDIMLAVYCLRLVFYSVAVCHWSISWEHDVYDPKKSTIHHTPVPQTRKTQTYANTETNLRNKWFNHWMVFCNTQSFVHPSPFTIHNPQRFAIQ